MEPQARIVYKKDEKVGFAVTECPLPDYFETGQWKRATDKKTGREAWFARLPRRTTGTPMTYRSASGRQFVVIATGGGEDASLVAFAVDTTPTGAHDVQAGTDNLHPAERVHSGGRH